MRLSGFPVLLPRTRCEEVSEFFTLKGSPFGSSQLMNINYFNSLPLASRCTPCKEFRQSVPMIATLGLGQARQPFGQKVEQTRGIDGIHQAGTGFSAGDAPPIADGHAESQGARGLDLDIDLAPIEQSGL